MGTFNSRILSYLFTDTIKEDEWIENNLLTVNQSIFLILEESYDQTADLARRKECWKNLNKWFNL